MRTLLTATALAIALQPIPDAAQIDGNGDGGPATLARLDYPIGIDVDAAGNVFFAEPNTSRIRRVDARTGIIETMAGGARGDGGDGGPAIGASFMNPMDIAVDTAGNVYVSDMSNSRVRRVAPNGMVSAVARVPNPVGVAVDGKGTVYVSLLGNRIARLAGDQVTIVAGVGSQGFGGDGGPALSAQFAMQLGGNIAVDAAGGIVVADTSNHRVRRVAASGTITTVAGTGAPGYGGDGANALEATFSAPQGVAIGPDGSIYVADTGNGRVRRITPDGIVRGVAGNGGRGMSGDGGPAASAQLNKPISLAVDAKGTVYIADHLNARIRKVTPDGVITTVAGSAPPPGVPGGVIPSSRQ